MSRIILYRISLLLLVCVFTQSCIFEGITECEGDYYGKVKIENDWVYAPDAEPEGMGYFFFSKSDGQCRRFDMAGREGGEIKIPTGSYSMLLFNDDTSTIIEENDNSFDEMSLSTSKGPLFDGCDDPAQYPKPVASQNQIALRNPDEVWGFSIDNVEVELADGVQTVHTTPFPLTATYHVLIRHVSNLDGVVRLSGAVSGMAESVNLRRRIRSDAAVIMPCGFTKTADNQLKGKFHTFGRSADDKIANYLYIFVQLTDGKRYVYDFNVTNIVASAPDPMDVWIIIDRLDLPESGGGEGGGFNVNVDGWNHVIIRL